MKAEVWTETDGVFGAVGQPNIAVYPCATGTKFADSERAIGYALWACGRSLQGACMADLDAVLEQLRQERKRAEGELRQLEKV